MKSLEGRRIVVTGAASGIGARTSQILAEAGASLILVDRDRDRLIAAARELGAHDCPLDVTDEAAVLAGMATAAGAMGGIDGLVNAAGIMATGHVEETTAEIFRRVVEINLTGIYIVTRACLPYLRQSEAASVVHVASAQGLLPNAPGHTAYAASKGGVVNLSRAMAAEFAPQIRVNCVCPGMVDTPMADGHRGNVGNYALRRIADPAEIARAILFLLSADSSYVTGATLAVDGGRSFH